ncbi:LysE family translocator, partial [Paenibacillus odorifer]|uniref:LysE family translocator n=2 Tax=Paenibacillus TaxID=44249 RepID=UPI0028A27788
MPWEWMAKGMLLGLSIAAPLGPISILCIKKTLSSGFKTGLCCGLGAATADAVYGSIAGFGLSALTAFLVDYKTVLQALGGLFICYLGMKSLLEPPDTDSTAPNSPKS